MKRWMAAMFAGVSMAVVTGCLSPRTDSQPMHTYQIVLDEPSSEVRQAENNGLVLLVSPAQAEPGFDTPRMVYLKREYEMEYYAHNQWADTPARMFTQLLIQALDRNRVWRAVMPLPSSTRGDWRLDVHGLAVQQEFLQQPSRVRVMVRVQLIDLKEARVIGTQVFEAAEDAPSDDAYGGVLAANRAMAAMLDQISVWLQGCAQRVPACVRA